MLKRTLTAFGISLIGLFSAVSSSWAGVGLETRLELLDQKIQAESTQAESSQSKSTKIELYVRRALILTDLGEFKRALADLDTAAQLGPIEQTYYARGVLFYRLGQFDTAIDLFSQYLDKYPMQSDALLFRARVLRDSKQTEPALNDYLRYLNIVSDAEPGTYLAATQLMLTLIEQGSTKYNHNTILTMLDKRIAQHGQASQLQRYAIDVVKSTCQSQQAIQRLNQLPNQSKQAPQWHLQLAEQYWLLNDAEQASQHLRNANNAIQQKRPSAFKAEQQHRYQFLQQLLETQPKDSEFFALTYQNFYPAIQQPSASQDDASAEHHHHDSDTDQPHTHDHQQNHNNNHQQNEGHTHSPLADLQQPQKAGTHYQTAWAEPITNFYQCAMQQLATATASE